MTSEAIHTITASKTTKISHQTRFDPTWVQTLLTQSEPSYGTTLFNLFFDTSEQTAFEKELIKLYGDMYNEET